GGFDADVFVGAIAAGAVRGGSREVTNAISALIEAFRLNRRPGDRRCSEIRGILNAVGRGAPGGPDRAAARQSLPAAAGPDAVAPHSIASAAAVAAWSRGAAPPVVARIQRAGVVAGDGDDRNLVAVGGRVIVEVVVIDDEARVVAGNTLAVDGDRGAGVV